MIRAKNYKKLSKFVKVTNKILSVPFFRTRCIWITAVHRDVSVINEHFVVPHTSRSTELDIERIADSSKWKLLVDRHNLRWVLSQFHSIVTVARWSQFANCGLTLLRPAAILCGSRPLIRWQLLKLSQTLSDKTTSTMLLSTSAFDTWALRKILRIPYTRHVLNAEVRRTTGCSPLSHLVTKRRLRLFGHIARSSPREDHNWALAACIRQVPPDWKRPARRPSHT